MCNSDLALPGLGCVRPGKVLCDWKSTYRAGVFPSDIMQCSLCMASKAQDGYTLFVLELDFPENPSQTLEIENE